MGGGSGLIFLIVISVFIIVLLSSKWKVHPFIAILAGCFFLGIASGMETLQIIKSIEDGFGGILRHIGLIVVFGCIIGIHLERSGGAFKVAEYIMSLAGKGRAISGVSWMGAVISIPVFCDSGFILLSGLSKKMADLAQVPKGSTGLALATGLYTTHTLIPPTPGPIAAAGNIGAGDYIGTIILLGMVVTIPVLVLTQWLSKRWGKNLVIPDLEIGAEPKVMGTKDAPSLVYSFLPIVLPIVLISSGTIYTLTGNQSDFIQFISSPSVALFIGALSAMILLRPSDWGSLPQWTSDAMLLAGPILIITGAGGAFGGILRSTPLAEIVTQWMPAGNAGTIPVLIAVFIIAAVLKTAQGSSTNAMVIASSILAPLVAGLGWENPILYALAVLSIGGGAMVVSHYNDSYFWIVNQVSGMGDRQALRSYTLITLVQGLAVLLCCIIIALMTGYG